MSCSGLHCAGCAGGAAVPVGPLIAFCGAAWVAEHLVEVAIVSGVCGVLAVAAVAGLIRWGERREARHGAQNSLWTAREAIALARPAPQQAVQAPAPPPIVNNYGPQIHIHGRDGEEAAARIVRQALAGHPESAPAQKEIKP